MWSEAAKEKTKRCAIMAGMPDNIVMITEPEAAALSIIRDQADEEELSVGISSMRKYCYSSLIGMQVGDTFIVCDAGGGTVVCDYIAKATVIFKI